MVKAVNQQSVLDLTDGFGVFLSSDATIFKKNPAGTFLKDTDVTQVSVFKGTKQVAAKVITNNITKPTGVTVISDGQTTAPTLTIKVSNTSPTSGVISIPITIGTGDETIIINKTFTYSITQDGVGQSSVAVAYAKSSSGTEAPSGSSAWKGTIAEVDTLSPGEYLWTKTVTSYNDGTSQPSYTVSLQGNTGNGIKSSETTYQVGTSGTSAPTGTWNEEPQITTEGQYLWTKTVITYDNGVKNTQYSISAHGAKGSDGEAAWSLDIESDGSTVFRNNEGSVTLTARVYQGASEIKTTSVLNTIKWYKNNTLWTGKTGKTCVVTANDVDEAAVIKAELP